MKSVQFYVVLCLVLLAGAGVRADVRLPAVIGDNMVIQQGMEVPIWGWAEPGEHVIIKFGPYSVAWGAKADETGKWKTRIGPFKAGGPFNMSIDASNTIEVKNVLVGEVWVCSGQSNMAMKVSRCNNADAEIAAANYPEIRMFTVGRAVSDKPLADCNGLWEVCEPNVAKDFSAAGYYFGREIHKKVGVPVGLIHTSWGGVPAETWMRKDVLEADADFSAIVKGWEELDREHPRMKKEYDAKVAEWEKESEKAKAEGKKAGKKPSPSWELYIYSRPHRRGGVLYNGMLAPVIPYGIRGAIWYQGESNRMRAHQYRRLFPAMIKNWRDDWGQEDFPFYYVQIAPVRSSRPHSQAGELREAQMMTLAVANTGMAVTMDIGNVKNIHPKNKQDVGQRLALWALAKTYGHEGVVYSGPIYKSMKVEGGKVRLQFDHVGSGLMAKGGALTHFVIARADKEFVEAKAVIEGDTVVVWSEEVVNPAAVRYGWASDAEPNLFNKEGLPASSFRTDDWPGVTFGVNSVN